MAISYGAQQNGLLYGYSFEASGAGRPVTLEEAVQWLAAPADEAGGFLWLHFDLTAAAAESWMQANLPLPGEFFEALRQGSRSTRIEDAQDQLIAVVNDVAYEFSFDPSEIATLWMSVNTRLAVTCRAHPLRSIDRLREAVKQGASFSSSVDLLNHLLKDQGDVLVRIVREATNKVDSIEDSLLRGRLQQQRSQLGSLRRVLVRLQRLLAPEPGALFRLLRQPPPWVPAHDLEELRQATEEFSLVIRDLSALQERIKLLQEEIAAQVSEQTNRSLFTLTMVTVLALPINITTGFFGMNVGGIPFAEHTAGFVLVVLLVAVFTAVAGWLAFRRRD
ncbi:transporter [Piscinibacter sp. HJYY11]|uniref:transporter n=1 Tax=Piscinibacter sp. HJYY11 TaxID=2801333 RepID=UPI00191CB19B|nr:transporter [Piscinibacter sp. HJYY11]MBL0726163.1 transporter [Piscinibacter sp. HJYY11]